jgi:hypothetical protein
MTHKGGISGGKFKTQTLDRLSQLKSDKKRVSTQKRPHWFVNTKEATNNKKQKKLVLFAVLEEEQRGHD